MSSRMSLTFLAAALLAASSAFAQNAAAPANATQPPSSTPSTKPSHSATETRPDAKYPHPSGQDSPAANSSGKTQVPTPGSRQDQTSGRDRNPKASGQSKRADRLAKRKAYTGDSGSKANPSTACTTARPAANGGVDCGMSGKDATLGKTVTKPH